MRKQRLLLADVILVLVLVDARGLLVAYVLLA
jgi:hypothetical protein